MNATGDGLECLSRTTTGGHPQTQNIQVSDCLFEDCWDQCVHLRGLSNCRISNCTLEGGVTNDCFSTVSSETNVLDVTVDNCTIKNSAVDGVHVDTDSTSTVVSGFYVNNCLIAGHAGDGIHVGIGQVDDVRVTESTVRGNGGDGVRAVSPTDVHIVDCNVRDNRFRGIRFDCGPNDTINKTEARDNFVYNNNRGGNGVGGILVRQAGGTINEVLLEDNLVLSDASPAHHRGIFLREAAAGTQNDVIITGNSIKGATELFVAQFAPTKARNNDGYVVENSGENADAIDLAARGPTTVTNIAHGLDETPTAHDVDVRIRSDEADDWAVQITDIFNIDETTFDVTVNVESPSAGVAVSGRLEWRARAPSAVL